MRDNSNLVSACGLYCGACYKYKKGKCPGCTENNNASWCKIRQCTKIQGYATCADCDEFEDVHKCKKFNTLFAKFFYYFFKSDRRASLQRITEVGISSYGAEMAKTNKQVIQKK